MLECSLLQSSLLSSRPVDPNEREARTHFLWPGVNNSKNRAITYNGNWGASIFSVQSS